MPLAASYLRPNDYSVLKFSPYRLNVNDIAKTLAIKTAYWNQGAERVKSRYMDALNLDVTNPQNQAALNDYVSKSEEMIKTLSSQDLGNPDIQEEGINIFKNLFSDRGIMFDDALTKHYKKVEKDYYGLLKTNPSKASQINLGYALEDREAFRNDPDRNSSESYYQKKKEYIPYYDATQEINNVMKNCKANAITGQAPLSGTGYSNFQSDKSLAESKVKACFEAGLSDQARQQFNITGYMSFKNNKDALANEYMNMNNTAISRVHRDMEEISLQEATLLNKKKAGTATPEDLSDLNNITANKQNLQSQLDNYTGINQRLGKRDYSDLDADFENIAGSVFADIKTSAFGRAFSFNDLTDKFVDDPVGMLHIRQAFEAQQDALDRANRIQLKEMDISAKAMSEKLTSMVGLKYDIYGKPIIDDTLAPETSIGTKPEDSDPYAEFNTVVKRNTEEIISNNKDLAGALQSDKVFIATLGASTNPDTGELYADVVKRMANGEDIDMNKYPKLSEYVRTNTDKNHPDFGRWSTVNSALLTKKSILDETTKTIESQKPDELPVIQKINNISTTVDLNNGISINSGDIYNALQNKPGKIQISYQQEFIDDNHMKGTRTVPVFTINGQIAHDVLYQRLESLYSKVNSISSKYVKEVNDYRKSKYGEEGWSTMNFYNVNVEDKAANVENLRSRLANIIPGDEETKKKAKVFSTNYQGGVRVYLPGFNPKNIGDISDAVGGVGATRSGQKPDVRHLTGDTYLIQGLSNFDYSRELGLDPNTFDLGINLKAISRNLQPGKMREIPFPVPGIPDKEYSIRVVQTSLGPDYRLIVNDKKKATETIVTTDSDPFTLMRTVQTLQNTFK